MGFVLTPAQAQALFDEDARNHDVIFPYLNGEELNSHPEQIPSRFAISFWDWPLHRSATGSWLLADEEKRQEWLKSGIVPSDYPDAVASDYPQCLEIVERLVKPERQRVKEDGSFVLRKPLPQRWWHYADKRPALYGGLKKRVPSASVRDGVVASGED